MGEGPGFPEEVLGLRRCGVGFRGVRCMSSSVGAEDSQPPEVPILEGHHRGTEDVAVTADKGYRPPLHPKVKAQHRGLASVVNRVRWSVAQARPRQGNSGAGPPRAAAGADQLTQTRSPQPSGGSLCPRNLHPTLKPE